MNSPIFAFDMNPGEHDMTNDLGADPGDDGQIPNVGFRVGAKGFQQVGFSIPPECKLVAFENFRLVIKGF